MGLDGIGFLTSLLVMIKGEIQGRFDLEELKRAVKDIIMKRALHEDAPLKDILDGAYVVLVTD